MAELQQSLEEVLRSTNVPMHNQLTRPTLRVMGPLEMVVLARINIVLLAVLIMMVFVATRCRVFSIFDNWLPINGQSVSTEER